MHCDFDEPHSLLRSLTGEPNHVDLALLTRQELIERDRVAFLDLPQVSTDERFTDIHLISLDDEWESGI